jgi:hypothetical protein
MGVYDYIKNNKRLIIGFVFIIITLTVIYLTIRLKNNTPPSYINCNKDQTIQNCNGKSICIDNCKEGETSCGDDPCTSKCCSDDNICLNGSCCKETNICNDSDGKPSTCCEDNESCVNYACGCMEPKIQCPNSNPANNSCCDDDTQECCGDSGCCKKGNCKEGRCCDTDTSMIIDGKCCELSSVYKENGELKCCNSNSLCFDGEKASCCGDKDAVCYETGYCITNTELKGNCIVSGKGEGITKGKYCVNKLKDSVGTSTFKKCDDNICNKDEECKEISYRKPPISGGCTDSSQCSGLGHQEISQECFDVVYKGEDITYEKATCNGNKNQVYKGDCSYNCGKSKVSESVYCPVGDVCTVFKTDKKGPNIGTYCSTKSFQFGNADYNPEKITVELNGNESESLGTCGQYYKVNENDSCIMYNTKPELETPVGSSDWTPANITVKPIKNPLNNNYYCPLSHNEDGKYYTAIPIEMSSHMKHFPVQIAGTYRGYGTGTVKEHLSPDDVGPYAIDGHEFKFGPEPGLDDNLVTMSTASQEVILTGDTKVNPSDCYNHFNNVGVNYVELDETDEEGKIYCRARYNCDANSGYLGSIEDLEKKMNTEHSNQLAKSYVDNKLVWGGLSCYDGTSPVLQTIRDKKSGNVLSNFWSCNSNS